MGTDLAVDISAIHGYPVGWFSPTYKLLIEVWAEIVEALKPVTVRKNVQERRIETINGGLVEMWSLDDPDAGRGRKYMRAIVDEAAMVRDLYGIWNAALRATLVDMRGDAWFLSTPKGHNGFWQLFQNGQDDQQSEWASWVRPTLSNPYIDPGEVEAARLALPDRVFRQEFLAEFIDDAGGVFRGVMQAATATEQSGRITGHDYVIGVDWGKHNDFTVLAVVDMTTNELCYLDRFNQIDYAVQTSRLKALASRFQPVTVTAESNAMGEPIIEQLQRDGLPVQAFKTTNATKTAVIDALAMAFEQGAIRILNDPVLVGELQAYEMERLPSGMLRYSAPEGMHDDTVIALALAWSGVSNTPWLMW